MCQQIGCNEKNLKLRDNLQNNWPVIFSCQGQDCQELFQIKRN